MILTQLKSPHGFSDREVVRTKAKACSDFSFHFKGRTAYQVQAAELATEIRSILEALQYAHCETNEVTISITRKGIRIDGIIYAWTAESKEIAESATVRINQIIVRLRTLLLDELEVFVKVTLERTLKVPA